MLLDRTRQRRSSWVDVIVQLLKSSLGLWESGAAMVVQIET
jgi:hypothetical protein